MNHAFRAPSRPWRLGLVGFHHKHVNYLLRACRDHPDILQIVALAEHDPGLRQRMAHELGVPAFESHKSLLDAVAPDVVGLVARNGDRGAVVLDTLHSGSHVIADKPLCTTLAQLHAIAEAASSSGLQCLLMLEKRGNPAVRTAHDVIRSGEIGPLAQAWTTAPHQLRRTQRPEWMWDPDVYGGLINDLAVHDIDLLLWFSGATNGRVLGLAGNAAVPQLPGFTDHAQVVLETDTGVLATTQVDWLIPGESGGHSGSRMRLTGTQGRATLALEEHQLEIATEAGRRTVPLDSARSPVHDSLESLTGDVADQRPTWEALAATRVALLAQQSAARGAVWLEFQLPELDRK